VKNVIDTYAKDLVESVIALSANRALHLAGHNAGGLVIKKALILARNSADRKWKRFSLHCFTVAFFGVPREPYTGTLTLLSLMLIVK
jgi:hypothetical protein